MRVIYFNGMDVISVKPYFMPGLARKTQLILAIQDIEDDATLSALEAIVNQYALANPRAKPDWSDVIGTITDEEAAEMKKIIEETFENINPDDWRHGNGRH